MLSKRSDLGSFPTSDHRYRTSFLTRIRLPGPTSMPITHDLCRTIREVLEDFPEIRVATLFGSAATRRLTPASDIDIGVAGSHPLTFEQRSVLVGALESVTGRDVDLVDLQRVSGPILQQALCTGQVIVKHSSTLMADLLKKMWYNQADMMPLTTMIMRKQVHRFIHE